MALSRTRPQRSLIEGFTLIEVMIVVAIIGILAGIAYPAYTDYVRRGQVQEAFSQLSTYSAKMEQYYMDNRNYGSSGTTCANDSSASNWNTFPYTLQNGYFQYTCATSNSGQAYTITATGTNKAAVGNDYTIKQDGSRATTKFKNAAVTKTCWVAKGDEC